MKQRLDVPKPVRKLAERLEEEGFETWTVGGAVRDGLRGRPAEREDWDLTTRAQPAQMKRIFGRTVPLGPEYGTMGVFGDDGTLYEITTFRHDVVTYGRKAVVAFAETIEEDLARRDFTVNAMAWHPGRGLLDPHGGRQDLEDDILRAVGDPAERFREDYLRVLRGLRFAGSLGLTVEPATWAGLTEAVPGLARLSRERIREELVKVLSGPTPSRTLRLYRRCGALDQIFGDMVAPARPGALATVDALARDHPELRLAALLLCGGDAPKAPAAVSELLTRLRCSRAEVERIVAVMNGGLGPERSLLGGDARRRRWVAGMGRDRVRDVFRVWEAALAAGTAPRGEDAMHRVTSAVRRDERDGVPVSVAGLAVAGRDLVARGWKPGPRIGKALQRLLEAVWEDPSLNRREVLLERVATMEDSE